MALIAPIDTSTCMRCCRSISCAVVKYASIENSLFVCSSTKRTNRAQSHTSVGARQHSAKHFSGSSSHFWATVCKSVRPMLSDRCLSVCLSVCLSACDVGVLWPNGLTDQDETWHAGRPRPWPHCVRWKPSSPPSKRHSSPIFGSYPLRPNGCIDQDSTWYRGLCDFVLDGDVT